jgi:predicted DNA-binding WGR domain protein
MIAYKREAAIYGDLLRPVQLDLLNWIAGAPAARAALAAPPAANAVETPVVLYRVDPPRAMARFYALRIGRTLFGEWSVTRRWGRIGTDGREFVEIHETHENAMTAMKEWRRIKERRGYRSPSTTLPR